MRVHELADELDIESKKLLETLKEEFDWQIKNHMNELTDKQIKKVKNRVKEAGQKMREELKTSRDEAPGGKKREQEPEATEDRNNEVQTTKRSKKKELKPVDVIRKAKEQFKELTDLPVQTIIEVQQEGQEWKVSLEAIERKSIPDTSDILGVYRVFLDDQGDILRFNRRDIRRRGDTE